MRVLITGAAGFLGRKLAAVLLSDGLSGTAVHELILWDQLPIAAPEISDVIIRSVSGDLLDEECQEAAMGDGIDAVFHLAAVVSAQAEADFDLGLRVNIDGTRALLGACRKLGTCPRFVTTSSVAAFGGELPDLVPDTQAPTPRSTYGMTKVVGELMVSDYARKGFVDGRVIRVPTVSVRPGKPNQAASSFASSIIREPLNGEAAVCPVAPDTPIWLTSPRRAVTALVKAAEIDAAALGDDRVITLPGLRTTPEEMTEALARIGGAAAAARVEWTRNEDIEAIVASWPGAFAATRAKALGFGADESMDEIIQAHIEDEL